MLQFRIPMKTRNLKLTRYSTAYSICSRLMVRPGTMSTVQNGLSSSSLRSRRPHGSTTTRASLTVTDPSTSVSFPLVERLWTGAELRCMGTTCRTKKIAIIGVKVYAVALYVEAQLAARELGVRARGGFFETDDDYCSALTDGAFVKALEIELVRNVSGQQFVEALEESLKPRMALSGDMGSLQKLQAFFTGKTLSKGAVVVLVYRLDGVLDVVVREGRGGLEGVGMADLSVESAGLSRAIFETYLGGKSIVPEGRAVWAEGARKLIESDTIRRQTGA